MTAKTARSRRREPARHKLKPGRPWIGERNVGRLRLGTLVFGFVACGIVSVLLGQDNNWDLQNYHAYNAYAFLHDRVTFDIAPAQRQSYLNPLADVPFYLGSAHLPPRLFGFLMGGLHGLTFGLLFWICFVMFRGLGANLRVVLAALCTGLGVYGPVFIGELGGSQHDNLVGMLVLAAVSLYIEALAKRGTLAGRASRRNLLAGSLVLGAGVGLKMTVMTHAVAVAVAVLLVESSWRARARVLAAFSALFLAGFLLTSGYWMAVLWHEFRNPVFPFYNDLFASPFAETRSFADHSMLPVSVKQALAIPFITAFYNPFTIHQAAYRDPRFGILWFLLVAAVVRWALGRVAVSRGRGATSTALPVDHRFLLVFFVVSFVVWEATFSILRYTVCLEVLAPLLIVLTVLAVWRDRYLRVAVIAAAFIATAVVMRPIRSGRIPWGSTFWQVTVPTVQDSENAIFVITNGQPLAYLVPRFPPGIRWLGIKNNLNDPLRPTRMQSALVWIIRNHPGEFYLLTGEQGTWLDRDMKVLRLYNLALVDEPGRPIVSRHSPDGLRLLRLRRTVTPPASSPQ